MRIKHKVNVRIAEDSAMENLLFGFADPLAEVTIDEFEKQSSGVFSIAPETTEEINLGDINTVLGLFLRVDRECLLYLNGSLDAIPLKPSGNTLFPFAKFFMEGPITEVSIRAPVAEKTVTGVFCAWGTDAS